MTAVIEEKIIPMMSDVEKCLKNQAYHAALTLSLTFPDICSTLEYPEIKSQSKKRYKKWLEKYFVELHDYGERLMSGDIYALRCAYLHNGTDNIEDQKAREVLNSFRFVYSTNNSFVHNNYSNMNGVIVLQLLVDEFCNEILDAVKHFLYVNKENILIKKEAENIIVLEDISNGFSL